MVLGFLFGLKIIVCLIIAVFTWAGGRKFDQNILKKYEINSYFRLFSFLVIYAVASSLILFIILGETILDLITINLHQIFGYSFGILLILIKITVVLIGVKIAESIITVFIENQRKKITKVLHIKNIEVDLLKEAVRWGVYGLALLLLLNILKLQEMATTLVASAGIIGIVVAFATQNVIQSFLAGIAISMDKSIEVGDSVTVDGISGSVRKVKSRTTEINTWDGVRVIIPNSKIMNEVISNFSKNRERRINITLEVLRKDFEKQENS